MSIFDPILRKELNRELSWDELDGNFEQLTDVVANINNDIENTNDRIDNIVIVVDETLNQVVDGLQTDLSNAVNNLDQQILQTKQDAQDALDQARADLDLAISSLEQSTIDGFLTVSGAVSNLDDKIEQYQTDFENEVIVIRSDIDDAVLQAKTEIEGQLEQVESLINDRVNQLELDVNNAVDNLQQTTTEGFNIVNTSISNLDNKIEQYQTDFESEIGILSGDVANQITQTKTDLENQLSVVDQRVDDVRDTLELVRNDLRVEINKNMLDRIESDRVLFNTTALAVQIKQNQTDLTNALFEVDPATGTIRNLAYAYTDQQFTQAGLLIDGVNAEIQLQAQRVTSAEDRITNAESELLLQAGQIGLRATYTEVNQAIAGAIDAVLPAYSFGFFNSNEGWTAVNGTLTPATSKINLTWGDIENTSLSYVADENPLISISIERTGGSGWTGNIIITFDDNSTQTYTGVIDDIPSGSVFVRNLNLDGESTYTGNVTGIRLVLGASVDDTFTVNSITIGKPSATLTELEGITAQINQVGIELNALEASLTNYVTVDEYTAEGVTRSNVETVLNGLDSYAAIQATLQEFDTEDTLTKANYAALWVDAANANIEQTVQAYNAREGGLDDQLEAITGDLVVASSLIDAANGRISDQIVSISGIQSKSKDLEQIALEAEYQLYLSKKNQLEQGVAIAFAKNELNTLTNEQLALAEEILLLEAKFGTDIGQVNATLFNLSQALASETEARVQDISILETNFGNISDAIRTDLTELISNETEARITQIEDLETSFNEEILATKTELTELVTTETDARVTSIDNIEARLDTTDNNISAAVTNLNQAIADETQARTEAVQLLESDFNQTINASIDTVFLAVSDVEQSLSQQIVNLQARFGDEISSTSTQLLQAISDEQQARINQFNDLQVQFSGEIQTTRTELTNLVADETQARIQDRLDLEAEFAGNYATKFEVTDAVATETQSRLDQIQQLEVDFSGDVNAARQEAVSLVADESQARIQEISNLSATIGTTYATKTEVTDVVATETQARINSIETLVTSIENNYATISQVDQIEADTDAIKAISQKSLIAVSGLERKNNETALGQLTDAYKAYLTEKKVLDVGVSIASAENRLTALSDTQGAFAEELTVLDAKIGTVEGTVSANYTELNQAIVNETEARAQAILNLEANFGDAIEASATSLLETISNTEQSLSQQITNLQTEFNDDISASVGLLTQAISDEESARILQVQQLETQFGDDIVAAKNELTNIIADETQARISDISALETQFQTDLGDVNASLLSLEDAISSETQARVQAVQLLETNFGDAIEASANSVLEVVSDTEQALSQQILNLGNSFTEEITTNVNILTQAISDEESARINQFNDLQTQFGDDITAVETSLTTLISNETQARVNQIQEIETEFELNYATKTEVTDAVSTEQQARINQIQALETSFDEDVLAARQEAVDLVADETQARITAINNLSTEIGNTYASKTELTDAVATESNARVEAIDTLVANIEDTYATISRVDQIEVDVESSKATSQKALVSISGFQKKSDATALEQLIEGYRLYLAEKGQLEIGVAVARAETGLETLTTANQALAQELTVLDAKIGTVNGTVSANYSELNQAIANETQARTFALTDLKSEIDDDISANTNLILETDAKVNGNASAIAGLKTAIVGPTGDTSQAELILSSKLEQGATAFSRAFLGVTNVVGGVATISGILIGGIENGLSFQGNTFRLSDTSGNQRLYWDSVNNTWIFNGRLVIGGYAVNSEADIRALDGKTFETRYSTSSTTPTGTNPAGWTIAPPNTTNPIYSSRVTRLSNGNIEGSWSTPVRWNGLQGPQGTDGINGVDGSVGAGFYSVNVNTNKPTITTAYLTGLFTPTNVAGRNPVNKDTFFVKWLNAQDAYEFNGTNWIAATLVVNGSIIASGTIAGDRFIAGTEISGRIIKGGEVIVAKDNVQFMSIFRAEPFGASNDLVEWYGPRINGTTWNNTTKLPIYSGMTKLNAKTYKTVDGNVFFGGTFQAGTLSISRQSTVTSGALEVSTDAFSIPAGTTSISVTSSVVVSGSQLGGGTCPASLPSFSLIVNIQRLVSGTWQNIGGNNSIINAECSQDGPEKIISLTGGLTVNTNLAVSGGQSITLRAVATAPSFPLTIDGLNLQGTRALSITVAGN